MERTLPSELEGDTVSLEAPVRPPSNLPSDRSRFVGREIELKAGVEFLEKGRLLTVTGPGGGGKTRFAVRLAQQVFGRHPDGMWFVDLAPLSDPGRLPLTIASMLGIREQSGVPLSRTLVDHFRTKRALLLLDNCEHLLEACRTLVAELRTASDHLTVLASSREPLGLAGEQVYPLPPLSTPDGAESADPASLLRHASVALFVDRARLVAPDFELDATTASAVKEICRAMDGLPLAIELAAARVRVLTANEIAGRLDRLLALLSAQGATAARRHGTLRATLAWSLDALGSDEQRAFRTLAVFPGRWDLAAAASVLNVDEYEAIDLIESLAARSLVMAESHPEEARYRFLEPVRQYAFEQLVAAGESDAAQESLVRYFVAIAEQAGKALHGPDQSVWLERIGRDHDNVQAAIDACSRLPNQAESALRITSLLGRYWHIRGHLRGGFEAVRRALAMPGAEEAVHARAGALYVAGALTMLDMEGQLRAREYFEEGLEIFRELGDDHGVARCLTGLGAVASGRREFVAGAEALQEAQAIYRRLEDVRGLAVTLNNLGAAAWNQGDLPRAVETITEALDLTRKAGDLGNVALMLVALAMIDTRLGRPDSARGHLKECLTALETLHARHSSAAGALLAAAELATHEQHFHEAARWLGAADLVLEDLGLVFDESDVWWKERARCWDAARMALGEEAAASEYRSGRSLDRDQALRLALASLGTPSGSASSGE